MLIVSSFVIFVVLRVSTGAAGEATRAKNKKADAVAHRSAVGRSRC